MRRIRPTSSAVLVSAIVLLAACTTSPSTGSPRRATHHAPSSTLGAGPPAVPTPANPATGPIGPLRSPGGPFLVDHDGRAVLMHGVDLVYKVPPFEVEVNGTGPNVLTGPEVQRMATLGFDVVRLGIIWKGLEPGTASINDRGICSPGAPRASGPHQFDAAVFNTYLSNLDATIALLGRYGIYSLIDMHQDVYNEAFGGEGAPDWAVCTNGAKPEPKLNVPDWSVNLQGPGVVAAYTHFWDNNVVGDLQGEFDSVWARVAAHFKNDPWVIGYDPFNEPYGQGVPPTGNGAGFDAELQCFYAGRAHPGVNQAGKAVTCPRDDPKVGVIPRIEAADPNHLVFYEGNYATDSGPPNHIGPMPFPRLVLNFHDYCFLHVPNGPETSNYATVCGPSENLVFTEHAAQRSRDATSQQPGGPASLLTEFGATTDAADLGRITADADAHLTGWIYWEWLDYDDPTGSHDSGLWPPTPPTQAMLQVLSRPYPSAVAGTPTATSFNPVSGRFTLAFRADPAITEPTVVSVPVSTHYAEGYCAQATGARITSAPGADFVDVQNPATPAHVTVTITPGHC
jgi:endoglycosylceramidase